MSDEPVFVPEKELSGVKRRKVFEIPNSLDDWTIDSYKDFVEATVDFYLKLWSPDVEEQFFSIYSEMANIEWQPFVPKQSRIAIVGFVQGVFIGMYEYLTILEQYGKITKGEWTRWIDITASTIVDRTYLYLTEIVPQEKRPEYIQRLKILLIKLAKSRRKR